MTDLETALVDLAEHLDHPIGYGLVDAVRDRISSAPTGTTAMPRRARRPRPRTLLVAAAVIVVVVAAVTAIGPARHAIADWLGIGAVEVRHADHLLPPGSSAHTVPGAPGPTVAPTDAARTARALRAARGAVQFTIETPPTGAAGALAGVEVDDRVSGGLVVLRYPRFTLTEIASPPGDATFGKLLDPGAREERLTVAGAPGLWITGAHEIGYLDRAGDFRRDTIRRSGPVLVWARGGVTYRIEGLARLRDAQSIAGALH